jgi:hypothetical protein
MAEELHTGPWVIYFGHLSCKGENASLLFVDVILSLFPPNRGSNREDLEEENELGLSDKDG